MIEDDILARIRAQAEAEAVRIRSLHARVRSLEVLLAEAMRQLGGTMRVGVTVLATGAVDGPPVKFTSTRDRETDEMVFTIVPKEDDIKVDPPPGPSLPPM